MLRAGYLLQGESRNGPQAETRLFFVLFVFRPCDVQASRRSVGWQNPQSSAPGNRFCPIVDRELAIDALGVGPERADRDGELVCNLGAGEAAGQELEYFQFAFAEGFEQRRLRRAGRCFCLSYQCRQKPVHVRCWHAARLTRGTNQSRIRVVQD